MTIAEIEAIAKVINGMGDQAAKGLTIYLGVNLAESIIQCSVVVFAIILFYKALKPILAALCTNLYATATLKNLRDMLNIGSPGQLNTSEARAIIRRVKDLKEFYDAEHY